MKMFNIYTSGVHYISYADIILYSNEFITDSNNSFCLTDIINVLKMVGFNINTETKTFNYSEFRKISNDNEYDYFHIRFITPNILEYYWAKKEINSPIGIYTISQSPSDICTCDSIFMFNNGCKCGYWVRNKDKELQR